MGVEKRNLVAIFAMATSVAVLIAGRVASFQGNSESAVMVSYPNDGRFFFDQIDIEVRPPGVDQPFMVATRPGQHLIVALPVDGDKSLERRFAFVIHPSIGEEAISDHSVLKDLKIADLNYEINPLCLEETPANQEGQPIDTDANRSGINSCRPRVSYGQISDDVVGFAPFHVGLNSEWKEENSGILFEVVNYRLGKPGDVRVDAPMAKRCLTYQGVKVCACKVSVVEESRNAGCV